MTTTIPQISAFSQWASRISRGPAFQPEGSRDSYLGGALSGLVDTAGQGRYDAVRAWGSLQEPGAPATTLGGDTAGMADVQDSTDGLQFHATVTSPSGFSYAVNLSCEQVGDTRREQRDDPTTWAHRVTLNGASHPARVVRDPSGRTVGMVYDYQDNGQHQRGSVFFVDHGDVHVAEFNPPCTAHSSQDSGVASATFSAIGYQRQHSAQP